MKPIVSLITPSETREILIVAKNQCKDKEWDQTLYGSGLSENTSFQGCLGEYALSKILDSDIDRTIRPRGDKFDFAFLMNDSGKKVTIDIKTQSKEYYREDGERIHFTRKKSTKNKTIIVFASLYNKTTKSALDYIWEKDGKVKEFYLKVEIAFWGWIPSKNINAIGTDFTSWRDDDTKNVSILTKDLLPMETLIDYKNRFFPKQVKDL